MGMTLLVSLRDWPCENDSVTIIPLSSSHPSRPTLISAVSPLFARVPQMHFSYHFAQMRSSPPFLLSFHDGSSPIERPSLQKKKTLRDCFRDQLSLVETMNNQVRRLPCFSECPVFWVVSCRLSTCSLLALFSFGLGLSISGSVPFFTSPPSRPRTWSKKKACGSEMVPFRYSLLVPAPCPLR